MIKIFHVPGTRSVRVIWTCEELGLPYEVIPVDFSMAYRSSQEWRSLNPVGKVPVILAIGQREVADQTVSVRRLGQKDTQVIPLDEIVSQLADEALPPDIARPTA